jgi:tetratricopeptide (TPR) repeat protein
MNGAADISAARRLLDEGDFAGARQAAQRRLAGAPGDSAASLVLAEALIGERRPAAALRILATLIDGGDDETAAAYNARGRARNNFGDASGAEQDFRQAIALEPGLADAHSNLGYVLRGQQRWSEAEEAFEATLVCSPSHVRALTGLGTVCLETKRPAEAAARFERAIAVGGSDAGLFTYLGVARHRCGDRQAAERAYRQALELQPRHAEAWLNLGITLQDNGRLGEALEAYGQAVALAPRSLTARLRLAEAYLADGRFALALETGRALRTLDPGHPSALAVEALALQALGRDTEAQALADPERFVKSVDLRPPPGFDSVEQFNRALAEHVLAHPSLEFEPGGHATRRGRHTGNLLTGHKGPVAALERAVIEAAGDYRANLDLPPAHPFPGPVPDAVRLSMWAVVMESQGHQLPHIHPGAWLSGVYYVELPASLGDGGADRAGWIEFGLPPQDLVAGAVTRFRVRDFRPAPGRMFLFPSHFYHRTLPFAGNARRISIAFDVLRRS